MAAPDAAPRILRVELSSTNLSAGDLVSGTVTTTSNVASLEARIATYSISVPRSRIGMFHLTYRVPNVPFFLHGNYTMVLIARNTRGERATQSIPLTIH